MSNSLSISFICRESKVNRMGLAPIECSIIYGGSRTFIQLPRKECPDNFRRLMKCRRGNELKDFCLAYYGVVQSAFSCLFCSGVSVTPAILKQYLRGEYSVSYTVSQLCKEYLDLLKSGVSPAVVKLCAGHSNIKLTTSTYSHLTSVDVVRVINSAALG